MEPINTRAHVRRPGRHLGLGCLIAGACFLFEPFLGVFDFFPDCIGYLLFSLGLYRLADMDDRLADAARGTRRLALLGLVRLLALPLAFGLMSPSEQPVFILLAVFSLAVLDILLLVPMWNHLSGGLVYLGSRMDATAIMDRTRRRPNPRDPAGDLYRRNLTERYAALSLRFFILREVLVVLPELTVLTSERGGVEMGEGDRLYEFVGLFRGVAFLIGAVIGIVWLVQTIRFVRRVLADRPCMERLYQKYTTEVLVRQDMFARRAVKAAFICLAAAAFLTVDLYINLALDSGDVNLNLLPDLPAAILLLLSILFVRRYAGDCRAPLIATVAYGGLTVVTWLAAWRYVTLEEVLAGDSYRELSAEEVLARADRMLLLQLLTAVVCTAAFLLTLRTLYALARRYTGVAPLQDDSSYAEERTSAIHKTIRRQLIAVAVVASLCGLSTVVQWGGIPALPEELVSVPDPTALDHVIEAVYLFVRDGYYVIDIALGLLLGGLCVRAGSEVCEQMEYRSMMDG